MSPPPHPPTLRLPVCRMGELDSEVGKGLVGKPLTALLRKHLRGVCGEHLGAVFLVGGPPRSVLMAVVLALIRPSGPLLSASAPLPDSSPLLALASKSTWLRTPLTLPVTG